MNSIRFFYDPIKFSSGGVLIPLRPVIDVKKPSDIIGADNVTVETSVNAETKRTRISIHFDVPTAEYDSKAFEKTDQSFITEWNARKWAFLVYDSGNVVKGADGVKVSLRQPDSTVNDLEVECSFVIKSGGKINSSGGW